MHNMQKQTCLTTDWSKERIGYSLAPDKDNERLEPGHNIKPQSVQVQGEDLPISLSDDTCTQWANAMKTADAMSRHPAPHWDSS